MIEVVAAVIRHKDLYLCVQKGMHKKDYMSYKYEFPGGKVEDGEQAQEALVREIYEELELEIIVEGELLNVEHFYPDFKLNMRVFLCTCMKPSIVLKEHIAAVWLPVEDLHVLDWAAADVPIVSFLQNL